MKSVREYFSDKSGEQIFVLCLLVGSIAVMLLCVIARLCGILWFAADLEAIPVPNDFWQEVVMVLLLAFELIFVYKILCRASWKICFIIAITQAIICELLGLFIENSNTIINIFNLICYFIIPIFFVKHIFSIVESAILYGLELAYAVLFLVGRIGNIDIDAAYNFIYNVLGTIDYKFFIVSLYLVVKYFGGIKLWKTQKRLIFQKDLRK